MAGSISSVHPAMLNAFIYIFTIKEKEKPKKKQNMRKHGMKKKFYMFKFTWSKSEK